MVSDGKKPSAFSPFLLISHHSKSYFILWLITFYGFSSTFSRFLWLSSNSRWLSPCSRDFLSVLVDFLQVLVDFSRFSISQGSWISQGSQLSRISQGSWIYQISQVSQISQGFRISRVLGLLKFSRFSSSDCFPKLLLSSWAFINFMPILKGRFRDIIYILILIRLMEI